MIKPSLKVNQKQISIDDESVFISPNGCYGFLLSKKNAPFNLERIPKSDVKLDLFKICKPENRFKMTRRLIAEKSGELVNILKNDDREICVRQKYLKYFDDCAEFYQEKDKCLVVVAEMGCVVGGIMPMVIRDGDIE